MRAETRLSFETTDINSASFVTHAVGSPFISFDPKTSRVVFSFVDRAKALEALIAYESGESCPAKPLMAIRAYLYREVNRVVSEHRRAR